MKELKLNLNVNEVNLLIKALGQLPYQQVHELIAKIHQQATHQLTHVNGANKESNASSMISENG